MLIDSINQLESLLKEVKSGKVHGIYTTWLSDTGTILMHANCNQNNAIHLLGTLPLVEHELMKRVQSSERHEGIATPIAPSPPPAPSNEVVPEAEAYGGATPEEVAGGQGRL